MIHASWLEKGTKNSTLKGAMDDGMAIMIELDGNSSALVGLFANRREKKIYLQDAFFKSNPALVFPAVVISEGSVRTIRRLSTEEAGLYYGARKAAEQREAGEKNIFKTDSEMAADTVPGTKELVEYKLDPSLTKSSRGDAKGWNQFEANMRLFNVRPEFDEKEYTEVLDKNSEAYRSKLQMARRVEQEILASSTSDLHRLEERGLKTTVDDDLAYSTVVGDKRAKGKTGKNKVGDMPRHRQPEGNAEELEPAKEVVRPQPTRSSVSADDKISESVVSEARKKKMVVEIEGLEAPDSRMRRNGDARATSAEGAKPEKAVPSRKGSPKEGESGAKKAVGDGGQKKNVTFGWLNPKFESMRAVVDMIQSKFSGNFELPEKGSKWGTGPDWEPAGRGIISRSLKFAKSSSLLRSIARQSPVAK
jgi:PAB1-binding protein PBP1